MYKTYIFEDLLNNFTNSDTNKYIQLYKLKVIVVNESNDLDFSYIFTL